MSREFNNLQRALRNYGSGPIGFGVFLTWFYCSFNTSILGLDHGGGLSLEASWCVAMVSASAFALLGLRRPAASLWPHTVCAVIGTPLVSLVTGTAPFPIALRCFGAALMGVGITTGIAS